ncbi:MAG: TonB-dependent hemoglobin/transferrin/lactoferrin family receptor [Gammaproteobacteria bacterium]|nr:TonB-dependent hemoglobin/transferrin/lactoferrin family receptor [Gammaproteobacteria bacterium]MBU1466099.1 TonB-dependent hemoglobin/transferrin/lactoferrin family receptor [Gammaproteobacteria bacterium]MBU2024491.1 TonB-dependent hemoglobin/transferrin/lactoferrin family receptor [Gammaproteobacteria bacterium]MBU2237135.1 TonB-dependent hemoglobin/transferrin/lactoferrin family receptor [Gammaproteobacteria bacterium]MBU2318385.1 TonB-dependent hemoglobin/transferrin/lactoferrin family
MKKTAYPVPLSLIALSIMAANPVFSADTLEVEHQLDTVTIEADALSESAPKVGSSVSSIDYKDIEKTLVRNLDDLVRYEPGVDASQDSRFGISSINIRGLDDDRVKISVDGVTQADAYGPTTTYLRTGRNTVDLDSLESVEIIKGGDVVEGSGALGGVVKYRTKEPSSFLSAEGNDTSGSLKAGYKSASDEFNQTLTIANRTGKVESLLVYTNRDGHENENHQGDAGSDQTVGVKRASVDPSDTGSDNVLAKVQVQINDNNRIGFVGEYFHSTSESDLFSESSATDQQSSDDKSVRRRIGFFHENTQTNTLYDRLKWQVDYQDTKTTNKTHRSNNNRLVDRFYDEESTSLKADLVKQIDAHQIRYGLNYDKKSLENLNKDTVSGTTTASRFSPVADANIFGVYIEDSWAATDRLTLVPAIRYDNYKYTTTGDEYIESWGNNENEALTAQLAAEFALTETYTIFGKTGSGFRAPNLDELYYYFANSASYGSYQITPNPDLEPEESLFIEAGIRAQNTYGSAEFVAFYNDYKNFIEQVSLGSSAAFSLGQYTNQNLNHVVIKGVEIKGNLDLSKSIDALNDGWVLNGAIAYAEGDNLENGEPLDSISPLSAVVGLGYDAPSEQWGGKLNLTWASGKKKEDISTSKQWLATSDYNLVDLTAYYKPTQNLTFNAGLFNLTDEKYMNWNDIRNLTNTSTNLNRYTRAGRNFGIDATLSF